jgi:4-coumarate--CoA ligase
MTELSPVSHFCPPSAAARKPASIGLLLPNLSARLVADVDDSGPAVDVQEGEPGELWVRGPTVMKGYVGNARATAETLTSDGWLMTGDVAVCDAEGFFWIVDRKKELIKYKGFQGTCGFVCGKQSGLRAQHDVWTLARSLCSFLFPFVSTRG